MLYSEPEPPFSFDRRKKQAILVKKNAAMYVPEIYDLCWCSRKRCLEMWLVSCARSQCGVSPTVLKREYSCEPRKTCPPPQICSQEHTCRSWLRLWWWWWEWSFSRIPSHLPLRIFVQSKEGEKETKEKCMSVSEKPTCSDWVAFFRSGSGSLLGSDKLLLLLLHDREDGSILIGYSIISQFLRFTAYNRSNTSYYNIYRAMVEKHLSFCCSVRIFISLFRDQLSLKLISADMDPIYIRILNSGHLKCNKSQAQTVSPKSTPLSSSVTKMSHRNNWSWSACCWWSDLTLRPALSRVFKHMIVYLL